MLTKGFAATLVANLLLSLGDDDSFLERYRKAWKSGNFRWLDVDITPIYKLFGGKTQARKYFSIFGHFKDPMKFIAHPIRSAHHKGSVMYRLFHEAMAGTDWKGHRFTTISELIGVDDKGVYVTTRKGKYEAGEPKGGKLRGKTTTMDFTGRKGPIEISQLPSFAIAQFKGIQPIQFQNIIGWIQGEIEGFDAISRSSGLHTSSTYPSKKNITDDFVQDWLDAKKDDSLDLLRERVRQYNNDQKKIGDNGISVEWSSIAKKGLQLYNAGKN